MRHLSKVTSIVRPTSDRVEMTAGYFAAVVAVVAVLLWTLFWGYHYYAFTTTSPLAAVMVGAYAILIVVPVAFAVGYLGVKAYRPTQWLDGTIVGLIATLTVYAESIAVVGVLLATSTLLGFNSIDPFGGMYFFGGLGIWTSYFITFPLGALAGAFYGHVLA